MLIFREINYLSTLDEKDTHTLISRQRLYRTLYSELYLFL